MLFKDSEYGANRFSIRGFLAAMFHPRTSPCDALGVFTRFNSKYDVEDWRRIVSASELSSQCQLEQVVHCKCTKNKEHEFLLFHFHHPIQQDAEAILVSDRISDPEGNINNNNGSPASRRTGIRSSRMVLPYCPIPPHDSIFATPYSVTRIPTYLSRTYGKFNYLTELHFTSVRPSALQLSVLLSVINKHLPVYDLYQYQCYWYAHTVWEALKRLFPDCFETEESAARSSCLGFTIDKADSVDAICEQYRTEWARVEEAERQFEEAKRRLVEAKIQREGVVRGTEEEARVRAELQPQIKIMRPMYMRY
ncbi:hypothetical protein BDR04DRAFT_1111755 [Suillus decipiens]|nr:hypothetical protein BDR04DRAFT_1111755 [Suillus decipiens]